MPSHAVAPDPLSPPDRWSFNEGTHASLGGVLGAHPHDDGTTTFRVWAPSARSVAVIGDENGWDPRAAPLHRDLSGVWHGRIEGFGPGATYKFHVVGPGGAGVDKADPFAFWAEEPPRTASVVWVDTHEWDDGQWMATRRERHSLGAPWSIYEVHLGSWRYEPGGYRALAPALVEHLGRCGFTHVELLPVMEHPFYGSWGYQTTGFYAPTARYGAPEDLMYLVDVLHQNGFGVILDWVPSHFPTDEHGLARFDGTALYEHDDPRLGHHPDWDSAIFNYDRHEVRAFLLSSACWWLDRYHVDGLRVDAVASMLYRDYSRREGEWIPNEFGGRENLGAVAFLRQLNTEIYRRHPDVQTIAEESTAWPGVSRPVEMGGLGFGLKWDMGWMHDTLEYLERDPVHRRYHHDELTFRSVYAFTENYVLPLSHDEVVHGKGSLLAKQPGDEWQQFAGLRSLLGWQWATPGVPLLFMGAELGMSTEWNHEEELPWGAASEARRAGVTRWVAALNRIRNEEPALHRLDHENRGFDWVIGDDRDNSVFAFLRFGGAGARPVLVVLNATPTVRRDYRIRVPVAGRWDTIANSDDADFGGSGVGRGSIAATDDSAHGGAASIDLDLPPLAIMVLAPHEPS